MNRAPFRILRGLAIWPMISCPMESWAETSRGGRAESHQHQILEQFLDEAPFGALDQDSHEKKGQAPVVDEKMISHDQINSMPSKTSAPKPVKIAPQQESQMIQESKTASKKSEKFPTAKISKNEPKERAVVKEFLQSRKDPLKILRNMLRTKSEFMNETIRKGEREQKKKEDALSDASKTRDKLTRSGNTRVIANASFAASNALKAKDTHKLAKRKKIQKKESVENDQYSGSMLLTKNQITAESGRNYASSTAVLSAAKANDHLPFTSPSQSWLVMIFMAVGVISAASGGILMTRSIVLT